MGTDHLHRVCTYQEAEEQIRTRPEIYVNDCFCRRPAKEGATTWTYCGCPVEVCMGFRPSTPDESTYASSRAIPRDQALALFEDWKRRGGLFRFMENLDWICFCCSCGCQWFRDEQGNRKTDECDKSPFIEETDLEKCNLCAVCIDLCAWGARSTDDGAMAVDSSLCYGCSACEHGCPEDAIRMVPRLETPIA